jgi:LysM repeat protein
MQHIVKRGDTLWRLAIRNQGSGTQWPKLVAHHNNEVAKRGPYSGLLPIKNENLIFIGQTLFLPPRPKRIEIGQGKKYPANSLAKPVDMPINFGIGHETPACRWSYKYPEAVITAELSGNITIEMVSDNRHSHNLEILFSRDSVKVKGKLKKLYDPVLCKLLAEPSVKFEGGKVKLNSPIAAQADLGPYTIEVEPGATPMQMSGSIKPPKISATMTNDGNDYKYSADIEYKVDVTLLPKNEPVREPVAETAKDRIAQTEKKDMIEPFGHTTRWEKTVAERGFAMAIVSLALYAVSRTAMIFVRARTGAMGTTIMPPMIYQIDYRDIPRET